MGHGGHTTLERGATGGKGDALDDGDGAIDVAGLDVEMADGADALRRVWHDPEAVGFEFVAELGRRAERGIDIEEGHVGLDGFHVDGEAGDACDGAGEFLGGGVVLGKAVDVMVECVEGCGGEDAGLAHGAAEHLAEAVDALDGGAIAGDRGADGRAESLAEAAGDGVEVSCVLGWGDAGGDGGVPEACAVEVGLEAESLGGCGDGVGLLEWPDGAATSVVGVLDDDEFGAGEVVALWADGGFDIGWGEEAVAAGEALDHDA